MNRRGFTLIELLATTMLLALFMGSAVAVISSMGRTRHTLAARAAQTTFAVDPFDVIEWDVLNARAARMNGNRLVLIGYGALDFRSGETRHRPVEITYELRHDGQRQWLMRSQKNVGELQAVAVQTLPIAADVRSFKLDVGEIPLAPARRQAQRKQQNASPQIIAGESAVKSFQSMLQKQAAEAEAEVKENYVAPRDPITLAARPLGTRVFVQLALTGEVSPREKTFFLGSSSP